MTLTKGILRYEGLSPDTIWTITHPTKGPVNIWPIFTSKLQSLNHVRIRINPEHIELKSRDKYGEIGIELNKKGVQDFISTQAITDDYIEKIINCFNAMLRILNGEPIRLHTFDTFQIMHANLFEKLKSINQSHLIGLYKDSYGLCRLNPGRRKQICKANTDSQCIFLTPSFEESIYGNTMKTFLCCKFNPTMHKKQLNAFKSGELKASMIIGNCDCLRGTEI